jgi:hypothetical protein
MEKRDAPVGAKLEPMITISATLIGTDVEIRRGSRSSSQTDYPPPGWDHSIGAFGLDADDYSKA